MATPTVLFFNDRMHASKSAVSIYGASSTAAGNKENVRDTSWYGYWKPNDGTSDEYVEVDGAVTTWLDTTVFYAWIAYDARGADQNIVRLQQDSLDNPAFTNTVVNKSSFALDKTAPCVNFGVVVSNSQKRYYRLSQLNSDRGGGTKTAKIYAWGLVAIADVVDFTTFPSDIPQGGAIAGVDQVGELDPWGLGFTALRGDSYQEFELRLDHATNAIWEELRDQFYAQYGSGRAFLMQYGGLRNVTPVGYSLVQPMPNGRGSIWRPKDLYDSTIRLRTIARPL